MSTQTITPQNNAIELAVSFRENITKVQDGLLKAIADGTIESTLASCVVKHYFSPKDEVHGCFTYAREMTIPKGTVIIGKLHRRQHLNIISRGSVKVMTEHGEKHLVGPCTFISEAATKRAVYAEEDTVWTTIHTVSYGREEDLDKIEAEVIAPSYADLNLVTYNTPTMLNNDNINNSTTVGGEV